MSGFLTSAAVILVMICVFLSNTFASNITYSTTLATHLFRYSAASYCAPDSIQNWKCSFCNKESGFIPTNFISSSATQMDAYLGINNQTDNMLGEPFILLAFKGTDPLNLQDWIDDFDFFQKSVPYPKCSGCEIHSGFYDTYASIKPGVQSALSALVSTYPSYPVLVTGHSLGGALATIAAAEIIEELNIFPQAVYTFGAPRVGNSNWVTWYNSLNQIANTEFRRVTHYADPVPHLPFSIMNFAHAPQEIWYNLLNTDYTVCSSTNGEDKHCADSVLLPLNVLDHVTYMGIDFIVEYLECKFQA